MSILKLFYVAAIVVFCTTFLVLKASFACACEPKTTGYFLQMGKVEPTNARLVNRPGIAKSLTGVSGDITAGRQIILDRKRGNCLACHRMTILNDQPFHGDIGPSLNRVALRYTGPQLRQMLVDARKYFPKTIMPPFHAATGMHRVRKNFKGQTILTAQEIENVVAFLKTLN